MVANCNYIMTNNNRYVDFKNKINNYFLGKNIILKIKFLYEIYKKYIK